MSHKKDNSTGEYQRRSKNLFPSRPKYYDIQIFGFESYV